RSSATGMSPARREKLQQETDAFLSVPRVTGPGAPSPRRTGAARGIVVGIALIPVNGYIVFYAEPVRMMWLTNAAPFANVIFVLSLLPALNALLARRLPRIALSSADLIAVYGMLSIQTGLGSMNFMHWLMGSIPYGSWAATPSNRWASEYLPHLPAWLTVT